MLDNHAAPPDERAFASWLAALEQRHLSDLRFPEVTRALRALSADYVHRRDRVRHSALDGRGKRAAFALFFGPLHFMVVDRIARALGVANERLEHVLDLGCGTGAAGVAIASVAGARAITGIDRHAWALSEASWTYRHFGLSSRTIRADAFAALETPGRGRRSARSPRGAVIAAYTANELTDAGRAALLPRLLAAPANRSAILIVEPIARRVAPWWKEWALAFERAGGRADEWRFAEPLPELVRALDRAAGLDHREQTARSLWLRSAT